MNEYFELRRLKRDLSDFLFGVAYPHRPGLEDDELWALHAADAMVRARFSYLCEENPPLGFSVRFSLAGELITFEARGSSLPLAMARAIGKVREVFKTNEAEISLGDML